jgi:hypothetical protein
MRANPNVILTQFQLAMILADGRMRYNQVIILSLANPDYFGFVFQVNAA